MAVLMLIFFSIVQLDSVMKRTRRASVVASPPKTPSTTPEGTSTPSPATTSTTTTTTTTTSNIHEDEANVVEPETLVNEEDYLLYRN